METISLRNVSFQYTGENRINGIRDVNLSVREGECVLLAGDYVKIGLNQEKPYK